MMCCLAGLEKTIQAFRKTGQINNYKHLLGIFETIIIFQAPP